MRHSAFHRAFGRLAGIMLAASVAAACDRTHRGFHDMLDTPEAVATAVLDGIARRDRPRLERLAVTEEEFRNRIWPELPASRPERNVPWDYVWGDLHQKSRGTLASVLAQHGGRRYELLGVEYRGASTRYSSFEVRRDPALRVRLSTGEITTIRLFGSMLVTEDGCKLLSYVVD
jgi:hypothetical protein